MAILSTTDLLQEGLALHRRGAMAEAAERYAQALQADPGNADAHYYLGMTCCQRGAFTEGADHARAALVTNPKHARAHVLLGRALSALKQPKEALASFEQAIALSPELAQAHGHRADILSELGRHSEAVASYDRALALAPDAIEDWFNRGIALVAVGRLDDAVASFDRVIAARPDFAEASLRRAKALLDLGRQDEALACIDQVLATAPALANGWLGRGNVLNSLKRYEEALTAFERALGLERSLAEAWLGRGNAFAGVNHYEEALGAYDTALALKPSLAEALLGRGNVLNSLKRYEEALSAFDRALGLEESLAEAWLGRGNAFADVNRYDEALSAYDAALALKQNLAEAWLGRGNIFASFGQFADALTAYDRALAAKPDLAETWFARGSVLTQLQRLEEAFAAFDRAVALNPDLNSALGTRFMSKLLLCDWSNIEEETAQLLSTVRAGKLSSPPFTLLATPSSPADQLQCAQRHVHAQPTFAPLWRGEAYLHDRIRVAYLSADIREHPIAYLIAGLIERHDKSRFEITGLSFGPEQNSPTRQRIASAFERFVDVRDKNDEVVADLVRRFEIDIAVDLLGFTANMRPGVLARRPAPIQVNYLGYPGTMGAPTIDYILADAVVIPKEHFEFYTEKAVSLPDTYQVNDDRRRIADHAPTRGECGLPDGAFVFCCFNNAYKITPEIFDIWMRLMRARSDSVLWLLEANPSVATNLRSQAEKRGISPQRLIFARRAAPADHLARHRHADLFLDTLPYNAHTTASDALWAGLPLVTCRGAAFAGRVAASLLKAAGLGELVTTSLEDYEALALKLASDPKLLAAIKDKVARTRDSCALFDTDRFRRNIEHAYTTMVELQRRGEAPRSFNVEPQ